MQRGMSPLQAFLRQDGLFHTVQTQIHSLTNLNARSDLQNSVMFSLCNTLDMGHGLQDKVLTKCLSFR